jgi:hypothetical protein
MIIDQFCGDPMPYAVRIENDHILVEHSGVMIEDEVAAARLEALRLAAQQRVMRVLVNVTAVTNRLSHASMKAIMDGHATVMPPRPRAALVGRPDQEQDLRLIESQAVSRGMPIKVFLRNADALQWLDA